MSGRVFIVRNGRLTLDRGDGVFVAKPLDEAAPIICPYCGCSKTARDRRGDELRATTHCARCGQAVEWAGRLLNPCRGCGNVTRSWAVREDGKVLARCLFCGEREAYPD